MSLASRRISMLRLRAERVVDEQHAIQVVQLVLQTGGEQPVALHLMLCALQVVVAHGHPGRARHVRVLVRHGQAAFLPRGPLVADRHDLRVDHRQGPRRVVGHQVDDDDAQVDPDLRVRPGRSRVRHTSSRTCGGTSARTASASAGATRRAFVRRAAWGAIRMGMVTGGVDMVGAHVAVAAGPFNRRALHRGHAAPRSCGAGCRMVRHTVSLDD